MELYHKQLNSVAELRREQKRLKKAHKKKKKKVAVEEESSDSPFAAFAGVAGDFLTSKGSVNSLMSLALPLFQLALKKVEKGLLRKIVTEVGLGYIKWKAIDYGVTLAMRFIRRQKHKADKDDQQS